MIISYYITHLFEFLKDQGASRLLEHNDIPPFTHKTMILETYFPSSYYQRDQVRH